MIRRISAVGQFGLVHITSCTRIVTSCPRRQQLSTPRKSPAHRQQLSTPRYEHIVNSAFLAAQRTSTRSAHSTVKTLSTLVCKAPSLLSQGSLVRGGESGQCIVQFGISQVWFAPLEPWGTASVIAPRLPRLPPSRFPSATPWPPSVRSVRSVCCVCSLSITLC